MINKQQVKKAVEYFVANRTFFNNEYIGYPNFEVLIGVAQAYLNDEIGEMVSKHDEDWYKTKFETDGETIKDLQAEIARLCEALELVLPMAKGYAYEHQVGSNMKYIDIATKALEDK